MQPKSKTHLILPTVLPIDVDVGGVVTGIVPGLDVGVVLGVDLVWWMVFLMKLWFVPWLIWFGDDCVAGDVVGDDVGIDDGNGNCPEHPARSLLYNPRPHPTKAKLVAIQSTQHPAQCPQHSA